MLSNFMDFGQHGDAEISRYAREGPGFSLSLHSFGRFGMRGILEFFLRKGPPSKQFPQNSKTLHTFELQKICFCLLLTCDTMIFTVLFL